MPYCTIVRSLIGLLILLRQALSFYWQRIEVTNKVDDTNVRFLTYSWDSSWFITLSTVLPQLQVTVHLRFVRTTKKADPPSGTWKIKTHQGGDGHTGQQQADEGGALFLLSCVKGRVASYGRLGFLVCIKGGVPWGQEKSNSRYLSLYV